jgi:murein DD-endopeptidase MepM/ murein hydrolase activator NlpD
MRNLWREAGVAALLSGTLAACASPQYATDDSGRPASSPVTMARPQYPVAETAAAAPMRSAAPAAASRDTDADMDDAPTSAPLAAPVPHVDSESLPPAPGPSAAVTSRSDGARLQYASLTTEAPAAGATGSTAAPTSAAPVSTALPPPASAAPAESPPPSPPPPPPAADPTFTPQMVIHDQTSPPPPAPAPARVARQTAASSLQTVDHRLNAASGDTANAGDVIDSPGDIFENYEVQRGDHIDALARAFSTTRDILLSANHIRAPYVIHPGMIMKVPVAKAYVARSGDTLALVARRFSVGVSELAQLNHLTARADLQAGQKIGLPSSMRDNGPLPASYAYVTPPTRQTYTPMPPPSRTYTQIPPSQSSGYHPSAGYQSGPPQGSVTQVVPQLSDAEISQAARGRFVWPVRGDITAKFGPQGVGRRNDGIDIRASQGTAVKAAAPGEVVYAGNQVPGFGNLVLIKHSDGWVTAYAHLDAIGVQMKQQVTQGQQVGAVGTSGGASEPELHFEVRYAPTPADKARPVDPVLVLPNG